MMMVKTRGTARQMAVSAAAAALLLAVEVRRAEARPPEGGTMKDASSVIAEWPPKPQEAARKMIEKYGQPDEFTESHLVWKGDGPWRKTIVSREEIPHSFPMAHTDLLEQVIDYRVPPDKFDELARYDGSVIVERTRGTIAARCDKEEMNFLALNLANDIVRGTRTVEAARDYYAKAAMDFMKGKKDPYTQGLQFSMSRGATADPDQMAPMAKEMKK